MSLGRGKRLEKIEYLVEKMEVEWYTCTYESISLER